MKATPRVMRVLIAPTRIDGGVSRLVELEDGSARVETWGADGWEPGGADVAEVLKGPPASPELLARLGVPVETAEAASLGRVSQDYDEIDLDAAIAGLKKFLGRVTTARSAAPSTPSSQLSDERLTRAIARGFWLADLDALTKLEAKAARFRTSSAAGPATTA